MGEGEGRASSRKWGTTPVEPKADARAPPSEKNEPDGPRERNQREEENASGRHAPCGGFSSIALYSSKKHAS